MTINTDVFTPVASLTGGVMIGLAAMVLILCCGRIAGISGIIGGLLSRATQDKGWRLAFVVGMLAAPWLYRLVGTLPASEITTPLPLLVIAGLLVGWVHAMAPVVPVATEYAGCRVVPCVHWWRR